jgi:peptidoglycan/LPS O-acetylase OafA/YrhL
VSIVPHRNQLDGLRALAFLAVFLHHTHPHWQWSGYLGVYLFFTLSGFLITRILAADSDPSLSNRVSRFYWRRTLRIFPLYYFTLLWLALLGSLYHPAWTCSYLLNIKIFLDQSWPKPILHLWSLCVEEQFYLVWPLLFWLTPARSRFSLIFILLLASKCIRACFIDVESLPWYPILTPICGEYLLWGALAGWWEQQQKPLRYPADLLLVLGVAFSIVWGMLPVNSFQMALFEGTFDGVGYALIVLGLWRSTSWARNVMSFPPLVYLGKISYGLYVYHVFVIAGPINQLWEHLAWTKSISHWLFELPITIAIASVSYYVLELPFLRLKDRFAPKPPIILSSSPAPYNRPDEGTVTPSPVCSPAYASAAAQPSTHPC